MFTKAIGRYMVMRIFGYGILLILASLLAIGCSSGNEPVTPGSFLADNPVDGLPILASGFNEDGSIASGEGAIGVFSVHIDTETLNFEMTPLRTNASKDVLEVIDVTNFMNSFPCKDCATLSQIGYANVGVLDLLFGVRHPFKTPKFSEPVSGLNRADLHIFNVEGMLVFDDPAVNFPAFSKKVKIDRVINADGFCGYLDPSLDQDILDTDADIHPFKTFFKDYTNGNFDPASANGFTNIANPTGYMVMKQGSPTDKQSFLVNVVPGESLDFLFVVMATYGVAADNRNMRLAPVYQCPQFNKKAASYVEVEILHNNLTAAVVNSTCDIRINVLDINQGVAVGEGLGQMRDESNVSKIIYEIPGILAAKKVINDPAPDGGNPRDPDNMMYFDTQFTNELAATEATYFGLVEVVDSYSPGLNAVNENIGIFDGGARAPYPEAPTSRLFTIDHFSTYQVFTVEIGTSFVNRPPVADFITDPSSECYLPMGSPDPLFDVMVTIDASASFDPDFGLPGAGPCGDVVEYQFDFEWDGNPGNFSPDTTGPDAVVEWEFLQSGPDVIGVRVSDGCTPPMKSGIKSLNVTIGNITKLRPEQRAVSGPMDYVSNTILGQQVINTTPMVVVGKNVYIAWTAHSDGLDYVYAARSADGGCTWGPYEKIYDWADCPIDTLVFVALDKLADGSPILAVVSPSTVVCNYQAWFFVGENTGVNTVDWGRQYALDLFGANSAHIDIMGHPTDETRAYAVQWRLDEFAPQNLMFVEIKDIGIQEEPIFPHYEYDVDLNVYDLDLALEDTGGTPLMHVVYSSIDQVQYMSLKPTSPPVVTAPVMVSGSEDIMPRNPRLDLNNTNTPVVCYSAQNGSSDFNVIVKKATGYPFAFPNDPDYMTTGGNDENRPDIRFNPSTREWWLVYEAKGNITYQVLSATFGPMATGGVNTDDPASAHADLDPSIIYNPYDLSMNITWYEGTDSPTELSMAFNRTN
jgi:hypothetical protein